MALTSTEIVVPRRDDLVSFEGVRASLRYMKYFEGLTNKVNDISTTLHNTTTNITSGTHTTSGNETLICTVPCVITLNANPEDEQTVIIKRLNGLVTILGNGKKIDVIYDDGTIETDNTALLFFYSAAINEWCIL
jgi:hypothetical protein